jgi:hypothetical protein
MVPFASTVETMIKIVDDAIIRSAPEQNEQQVVLISGFPVDKMRQPNFALLHTVGKSE